MNIQLRIYRTAPNKRDFAGTSKKGTHLSLTRVLKILSLTTKISMGMLEKIFTH